MTDLTAHWAQCFADLDVPQPAPCAFKELVARYGEPHRAYHTLQHIEECFAWFGEVRPLLAMPGEVALALFYHDAVYDTHAHDNEERSAALACDVMDSDQVHALILATRHNAVPRDRDAQWLVDIDLSILGAPAERFDEYERQIRFEYSWVPDGDFREGRLAVLNGFAARPAVYATDMFQARLEQRARDNLARSIAALRA